MIKLIIKRLLVAIPTLIVIIAFPLNNTLITLLFQSLFLSFKHLFIFSNRSKITFYIYYSILV